MTKTWIAVIFMTVVPAEGLADSWSWLDKPEKRFWSGVRVVGEGFEVQFDIPERDSRFGSSAIRVPWLEKGERDQVIFMPTEFSKPPPLAWRALGVDWERYWGGFFKDNVTYFTLRVFVHHVGKDGLALDDDVDARIEGIKEENRRLIKRLETVPPDEMEWFFERFRIESHQSSQGYWWTVENAPRVMPEQEIFRIPVSDEHEIDFGFYYRQSKIEQKGGEDWFERRKALARQILDSVVIRQNP